MNEEKRRKTLTIRTGFQQRSSSRINRTGQRRNAGFVVVNVVKKKPKKPKPPKKVQAKLPPKKVVVEKKPKGPTVTPPKERLPLEEAISEIKKYWPQLFPEGKLVPIEVGMKKILKKDRKERDLPVTWKRIRECLGSIGNSLAYHELIVLGVKRYNKDGQVVAVVSEKAVKFSKKKIERINKVRLRMNNDIHNPLD